MGLKCGIVGLPNVGKSTLFNCLSNAKAVAANFPFCTIEPNIGLLNVPDKRLNELAGIVNPEKVVPNTIEIVDIAGLVQGASKGEGLGNQFLSNIRDTNAIIHVIRCFENDNISQHYLNSVDPIRDIAIIDTELQLKDLDTVEKRYDKTKKLASTGNKDAKIEFETLEKLKNTLQNGVNIRNLELNEIETIYVKKELNLLTAKPVLFVLNVEEKAILKGNQITSKLIKELEKEKSQYLILSAKIESEIAELENYEDKLEFLKSFDLTEPIVNKLIMAAYTLLGLETFFTVGKKEVRAWTINKNTKAPQAGGEIHSDIEKGFICVDVIKYNDFVNLKSEKACKDSGKMTTEGKNYTIKDGDIVHFKFNV